MKIKREAWKACEKCGEIYCSMCKSRNRALDQEPCFSCHSGSKWESANHNFCDECGRPLTEQAWEMLEKRLNVDKYKDAVERMGNFGRLFVQYSGDPRGQMGHRGNRNDEIEDATMFSTIEDVEGDVWRPVLERVLQSLIQRTKKAEQERDAAIADIKHIVCDLYEDDVLCKEFCKNHDGVCSSKAELGLYEDCRGFEWRGVQEE